MAAGRRLSGSHLVSKGLVCAIESSCRHTHAVHEKQDCGTLLVEERCAAVSAPGWLQRIHSGTLQLFACTSQASLLAQEQMQAHILNSCYDLLCAGVYTQRLLLTDGCSQCSSNSCPTRYSVYTPVVECTHGSARILPAGWSSRRCVTFYHKANRVCCKAGKSLVVLSLTRLKLQFTNVSAGAVPPQTVGLLRDLTIV